MCCLSKCTLIFNEVVLPSRINSDVLCLERFDTSLHRKFRVVLVYRPPNSNVNENMSLVDILVDLCVSKQHFILLGDFNIDVDSVNFKSNSPASRRLVDFFKAYAFTQHVLNPTR